jgi:hypothetical protein
LPCIAYYGWNALDEGFIIFLHGDLEGNFRGLQLLGFLPEQGLALKLLDAHSGSLLGEVRSTAGVVCPRSFQLSSS